MFILERLTSSSSVALSASISYARPDSARGAGRLSRGPDEECRTCSTGILPHCPPNASSISYNGRTGTPSPDSANCHTMALKSASERMS